MLQKENIIISNKETKETIDQEKTILPNNLCNVLPFYIPHVNENDFVEKNFITNYIPLNEENQDNEILNEIKSIMNETKINIDTDEYDDIYFIKKNKNELQSTDSSTKILTSLDNRGVSLGKTTYFKTLLCKRGRKEKEGNNKNKKNKKMHGSDDFDNIQRKIQVSFISFLIRFGNDALKSIFGKKTKFNFKDVNYDLKKKVNHNYIEYLKKCNYSDILQMKISPKNKKHKEDENKETFNEICQYSDILKRLFEKNYLYIFQKYYCRIKNEVNIDGIKIKLSPRTKPLLNLLDKNKASKDKFINVIKDVYFSQDNFNSDKNFIISSGN